MMHKIQDCPCGGWIRTAVAANAANRVAMWARPNELPRKMNAIPGSINCLPDNGQRSAMKPTCAAWLGCVLAIASMPSLAASSWLTLVGDPTNPAADYIEFDPASLARENGLPVISIRVSRVLPRTSKEGIVFRSFESAAAVDCKQASARFLRASFYAEPDFKGQPFRTVTFGPTDIRPMAFREIQGAPTQRIVRAACKHSAVKSLE